MSRRSEEMVRQLISSVGGFLDGRLVDGDLRAHHKDQCSERLAAGAGTDILYSDQAVLANLDWGIDALEEAISTSNNEAKLARLNHAERMLLVAAMLDPGSSTASVPNSYLSAWARLNLAYLCALRGDSNGATLHALEMFDVDPFFARIDFAPELWQEAFLPHMAAVTGWYSEARRRIVLEAVPDASELSLTADFGERLFDESVIAAVRPDQAQKLEELEKAYGDSLDHNTRLYAKYYRDLMVQDSASGGMGRKGAPLMPPIAEPPMTPMNEVSQSLPRFVQFGPVLPKSAGFSSPPAAKGNRGAYHAPAPSKDRLSVIPNSAHELGEQVNDISKETLLEEDEDGIDSDGRKLAMDSEHSTHTHIELARVRARVGKEGISNSSSLRTNASATLNVFSPMESPNRRETAAKFPLSRRKNQSTSFEDYSPADSPRTPSPAAHSSNPLLAYKKEPEQLFRLLSNRLVDISPKIFSTLSGRKGTSSEVSSPNLLKEFDPLLDLGTNPSASTFPSPQLCDGQNTTFLDSDDELEKRRSSRNSFSSTQSPNDTRVTDNASSFTFLAEFEDSSRSNISLSSSGKHTPGVKPPKDFVCPITSQLFNDPVTLETGQTYERKAIQEWIKRGNTTCPITRQLLSATVLPKTNYVLKRLVTSWIDQNPDLAQEYSGSETPSASNSPASSMDFTLESNASENFDLQFPKTRTKALRSNRSKEFMREKIPNSLTSVKAQAASETVINRLRPYTSCLCTSEELQECEEAVLEIARIWKDSKVDSGVYAFLCEPAVVNGFVEVLSASVNIEALKRSIYVLSELVNADESLSGALFNADTDFNYLASLLMNGLAEAAVLIYQLKPTFSQLSGHDLISALIQVIMKKGEELDDLELFMKPKDAAIAILEQILLGGDEKTRLANALNLTMANGLPALIKCLDRMEGRASVVSMLLSCMRADKNCRNVIANRAELAPVLELFHAGNDPTRSICIDYFSELVCLNRRTFCNQILHSIKDEGTFSTMHSFLVYLQMAPMEQQPTVAGLLLQLDLLAEPRKMSIYREEAIDAIIEALKRDDFPVCQTIALDMLSSLSGRLSASGKPMTEAWLLKIAGMDQSYKTLMKEERTRILNDSSVEEEEKAVSTWEKRVAFVLCNHEKGVIFKALEGCLRSNSLEMAKSCLVVSSWLTHMLNFLPETGLKTVASECLLDQFISILQLSKNSEEKILATLALKCFISDPDSVKALGTYVKCIFKPLRKLRCSAMVVDVLKAIMKMPSFDTEEFWSCNELFEIDSSANGEVLSMVHSKGRLFSSHSDGTIKMWDAGRRCLRLIQEVREHAKAVTCLYVSASGNKLYSGSHDKTIRVWTIGAEAIHSVQVHDMKEAVNCLAINSNVVSFTSQGSGAKVYNWRGVPKQVNVAKAVKSLAMTDTTLYCGCTGYSIQEVDLSAFTSNTLYSGPRKLLGKQSINALCIHDGVLFAGGSSIDGIAVKAFSLSTKAVIGSFPSELEINRIFVSNDFVYTGTRCGLIEVWLRERFTKVASIKMRIGSSTKVTSLTADFDGEMLYAGSSDGKIQVWTLD